MKNKILIINPFGIGDVIFSLPIVEILKEYFPDSFIGYVCNKRVSTLLEKNTNIDKIFIYEKDDFRNIWRKSKFHCIRKIFSFFGAIRKGHFDVSIDLSLGYQSSLILKLIGIKKRIGFNYRNRGKFLNCKIDINGFDGKHVIEHYLDLLKPLNIDISKCNIQPKIYASELSLNWAQDIFEENGIKHEDLMIGIIPGCGASWGVDAKYRRWGNKNFASLADELIEEYNAKILLFGNSKESPLCKDVEAIMKNSVINLCGKTSIDQMAALMTKCRLIITNDGGPLHMAVGLGVSTVSVFGPVDEKVYGPYPVSKKHIVVSKKDLSCRPCYKRFKYNICENRICLESIMVDEVFKACQKILNK